MATDAATLIEQEREVLVERRSDGGDVLDTVSLDPTIFGVRPNVPLMHQVVTAQLAARRSGTQSTKTRAEVAGGAAKPYRQKGTGRARQGTIRAPQFSGGGVALGPKPRSYAQRTPRKMIRLALNCALSDRASEGRICLVDRWSFEAPKTKDAVRSLRALGLDGCVLVVLGPDNAVAERCFANLPEVKLVEAAQLTAYEVLASDWVVFTNETILGEVSVVAGSAKPAPKPKPKAATKPKTAAKAKAEVDPADDAGDDAVTDDEVASGDETAEEDEVGVTEAFEVSEAVGEAEGEVSSPEASTGDATEADGASADAAAEASTEEDGE
jgi:large subunit ribosomal protein L4